MLFSNHILKFAGKEEKVKAGDAYYAPPNRTAVFEAGTELWEFSPMNKIEQTNVVVARNFERMIIEH